MTNFEKMKRGYTVDDYVRDTLLWITDGPGECFDCPAIRDCERHRYRESGYCEERVLTWANKEAE